MCPFVIKMLVNLLYLKDFKNILWSNIRNEDHVKSNVSSICDQRGYQITCPKTKIIIIANILSLHRSGSPI
jgi:hypothetical protein